MRKSDTKTKWYSHQAWSSFLVLLFFKTFSSFYSLLWTRKDLVDYNKNIRQLRRTTFRLHIKLCFFFIRFYSLLMSLLPHKKGKYMRTLLGDPWNQIFCTSLNGKSFKTTYITYQTVIKKPFSSFTDDLLELNCCEDVITYKIHFYFPNSKVQGNFQKCRLFMKFT